MEARPDPVSYVVWFDDFDPALGPRLGGKCAALGELTVVGLPVPPGFAVTIDAYQATCGPLRERLRALLAGSVPDDAAGAARAGAAMRELIEAAPLPDRVRDAVAGAYAELGRRCGVADVPVAVRSSAVGEDAADASFAGEHDTYLWVRGAAEVLVAVRRCWASLFTERAIAYRRLTGPGEDDGNGDGGTMGVAVQQMVLPRVAGVAFTLNPQNGDRSQIAIDASWGLGEAVVAGEVTPDSYLVDKVLSEITRRVVSDKAVEYRPAPDGRGIVQVAVPAGRRTRPCLSDEQVTEVARLARKAERHYGRPQDVEWAIEARPAGGYRVVLLQSRPETAWSRRLASLASAGGPSVYDSIVSTLSTGERARAPDHARLPSPFEVATPPGAEAWQELYTYSSLFSAGRREYEEGMFWFRDSVHWPAPLPPWDATFFEYALATLSQYNTKHYLIPAALGIDYRILHGYAYLAPVPVADPAQVQARAAEFLQRAGFYFANWDDLYAKWLAKIRTLVGEIQQIRFGSLPEKEDIAVITEGHGTGSGLALVQGYRDLLDLAFKLWMHHFEFLNLGYAAYLDFFTFCKRAFPGIPDQSVARMVAGIEVDLFRPDDELKKLARLAVELDVDDVFTDAEQPDRVDEQLRATPAGRRWLAGWDEVAEPWFNFSSGSGFYHTDRVWIEHREIPFGFVRDYAARLRQGADLARPLERLHAERDRIAAEYGALMPTDADQAAFEERLRLARVVFPYVENHNFYVEHWAHATIWRKMRELGRVLVGARFLAAEDDVFYLRRNEVTDVLWDFYSSWAVGAPAHGPARWPAEIRRRKDILRALGQQPPPPGLGVPPEQVTEPFTIMLWGITEESIAQWLGAGSDDGPGELTGMAASPGVAEGPARVISGPAQIDQVRDGEILVAPLTAPSWAPIFGRVRATVTDTGGIMSHAAIVCREYGLPAVTGTASGTTRIRTGQRIRVDGNAGRVTVLDEGNGPCDAAERPPRS
jgi:pyruvate,water dikinase